MNTEDLPRVVQLPGAMSVPPDLNERGTAPFKPTTRFDKSGAAAAIGEELVTTISNCEGTFNWGDRIFIDEITSGNALPVLSFTVGQTEVSLKSNGSPQDPGPFDLNNVNARMGYPVAAICKAAGLSHPREIGRLAFSVAATAIGDEAQAVRFAEPAAAALLSPAQ